MIKKKHKTDIDTVDGFAMSGAVGIFLIAAFVVNGVVFVLPNAHIAYEAKAQESEADQEIASGEIDTVEVAHIDTPESVRALYMTSWVAGSPNIRTRVTDLFDTTEANAVIIDIKDDTGKISFLPRDEYLQEIGAGENRIADIDELIASLHNKGVYVIGRVSVFQDPHLAMVRPDLAVKTSDGVTVWQDRKGLSWLDASANEVWDYVIAIARESYARGFDEINFDYVRFPTDGNTDDILFPFSGTRARADVIRDFFSYLSYTLDDDPFPISADLFGLTTTDYGDLGIGQVLEIALPYFDYIAPMVYPSHFAAGSYGIANPAAEPYAIISHSMGLAVARAIAASSSPSKLRPWLQDFDLGAVYTSEMVRDQIQATYDVGLDSWMMWDPSNRYTRAALLDK